MLQEYAAWGNCFPEDSQEVFTNQGKAYKTTGGFLGFVNIQEINF